MPIDDLKWALKGYKSRRIEEYDHYDQYYNGDQRLAFATEKFKNTFGDIFREFAENFCGPIVDALSDRLQITAFRTNQAEIVTTNISENVAGNTMSFQKVETHDPIADSCMDIWTRNRMDLKSGEVHTESLKLGDGFVIVWPDPENLKEAQIWPQCAWQMCIQYDANIQGKVIRASKIWYDEVGGYWYLNIYLPFGIEKYIQKSKTDRLADKEDAWSQYTTVNNPYGQVPVFHFPNRVDRKYGFSELESVIPIQDGLNKSCMDMMIAMEFASFKQRYVIGLEVEIDEVTGEPKDPTAKNYGVDRLMAFADPDTSVGQFDATDLGQFLRVQEKFWASAARISGTPLHYFFITQGDFPSGEAMKSAEARFVKKIKDRQTAFGNVWEDVMRFCLKVEGGVDDSDLKIDAEWVNAAPRSEAEIADTAVKKRAVGVSRSQILRELGYDEEEIMRMLMEADSDAQRNAEMQADAAAKASPNGSQGESAQSASQGKGVRK